MDKVKELVEWAASIYCQNCRQPNCDDRCNCDTCYDVVKEIFSHPDLALIDKERELPHPDIVDINNRLNYQADVLRWGSINETYRLAQQDMGEANWRAIIPLAEALKEEVNG